jgi:hypothetical protein
MHVTGYLWKTSRALAHCQAICWIASSDGCCRFDAPATEQAMFGFSLSSLSLGCCGTSHSAIVFLYRCKGRRFCFGLLGSSKLFGVPPTCSATSFRSQLGHHMCFVRLSSEQLVGRFSSRRLQSLGSLGQHMPPCKRTSRENFKITTCWPRASANCSTVGRHLSAPVARAPGTSMGLLEMCRMYS